MSSIPLHKFHERHGARFVDFSGWHMPVQYTSILEEHRAVRNSAGLFDVSHMGEFHISGKAAARFLDRMLTNRIASIPVGKAVYSPMCDETGGVVDDLIVYRTGEEAFLVCVNAGNIQKDFDWFMARKKEEALKVEIEDHSVDYALLALQGPQAEMILKSLGLAAVETLRRFEHIETVFQGEKTIRICRTGYTGEDGFEIYVSPKDAEGLARSLMETGSPLGLKLCGLGCRDSLRLEAGYPLYGHELSSEISPLEAGLGWTVKFDKEDFVGKKALTNHKEVGISRRVVHFTLEGRRIAREGTEVLDESGKSVGRVLSGTISPMLGCPIGSAIISVEVATDPLFVDLRGHKCGLKIEKPPLHKQAS